MARISVIMLVCIAYTFGSSQSYCDEWTRFRGPNGSGLSNATTIPANWNNGSYNWVAELPGIGHSSPVVWKDKLFVTCADVAAGKRYLICIRTGDGKIAWKKSFDFSKHKKHKNNSFASSTPAVDADHVYVLWHSPGVSPLIAFDHDGNHVWDYDLGPYRHGQGPGTSPITYQNLVVVSNDHAAGSFLLAVDRQTGKSVWRIDRVGKRACYSTPCILKSKDHQAEIVFTHCFEGIIGVDAATGKQNWKIDVFGRFPQRAVASPYVARNMVIAGSGARVADKNVVAVRAINSGSDRKAVEVFRIARTAPHVPTSIAFEDWMFLWSDSGIVTCASLEDGAMVWQKRVGGNFFGSPVCVNGKLYCVAVNGEVVVLAASGEYEKLGRNALGNPSRATPAISGGVMYFRSYSQVYSLGGNK